MLIGLMPFQSAAGDFYQYTDENGNMVFTDDITQVPQEQLSDLKRFESVNGEKTADEAEVKAILETETVPGPPPTPKFPRSHQESDVDQNNRIDGDVSDTGEGLPETFDSEAELTETFDDEAESSEASELDASEENESAVDRPVDEPWIAPEETTASSSSGKPQTKKASGETLTEDALDIEKQRMDMEFEELRAQQEKLNGLPTWKMNQTQRNVHNYKVEKLNERIREHQEKINKFKQKVDNYNSKVRSDQETAAPKADENS